MSPGQNKSVMQDAREVLAGAKVAWWGFFDWLAVVSWRNLAILFFLVLIFLGPLRLEQVAVQLIVIAIGIKVLAGGKRRSDLLATTATARADVEALERRLLEAQIAALQAQVEPHFLFNTLALIGQLIETDPPQAAKIHTHLIQYLRTAIPQMRESGGDTLGRQVELARAYLAIMQARMKERLTVSFNVPPELEFAPFPPLMLQTLVENSIKHGLEPKPEGGRIDISASVVGDLLRVVVTDDGMGFDLHADDGVGLRNIRERLKILYNGKARLVVEVPAHGGARTIIQLPYPLPESR